MPINLVSCINCGSDEPDTYSFCHICGTKLQVITYRGAVKLTTPEQIPKKVAVSDHSQTTLYKKLEFYRDRVLNTDLRNRSILLRNVSDKWFFDLAGLSSTIKIVEHALLDRRSVCIVPNSDRSSAADKYRTRLRNFSRNITQIRREIGREETYLGFPFLEGHLDNQVYIRGPFVLFPASISYRQEARPAGWYITFSEDKDPILNRALMQMIKKYLGLPESLNDNFEKLLKNLEERKAIGKSTVESLFLHGLIDNVLENNFPIDYTYDIETTHVLNKISVNAGRVSIDERKSWIENEKLHLANFKVIGNFPQGENAIYLDYEDMIKKAKSNGRDFGMVKQLLLSENEALDSTNGDSNDNNNNEMKDIGDKEVEPIKLDDIYDKLNLAIASDSSQDNVVWSSQSAECIVVRGPPGTGKSQVIVNLISNALSKDQKVLLVCDKKQALEVVYNRLDKVGLSRYVAHLSDVKNQSSLYKKFSRILESQKAHDDYEIGSINRKFERYSKEIREVIHEQNTMVDALKDESIAGISANKLYSLCKPGYVPRLDLSYLSQKLKHEELPRLLETIRDLEHGCKTFDDPNFPWASRKNFSNLDLSGKHKATATLDQIIELSKKQEAIFASNSSDQRALVSSINALGDLNASGGGRFRKLFSGGKERAIRENIQRLINRSNIPVDVINDPNISGLGQRARIGIQIWDAFSGLSNFISEDAINNLATLLREGNHNLLISTLAEMRRSLDSFFYDLQAYDRKKSELKPIEKEILQMCMENLPIEDKSSRWDEVMQQDFYFHWIDYIEQKHLELKGQPFEKYMVNRDRLSKLINEHQALVIRKILSQIDDSIIRPEITSSQSNRLYKARYDQWNTLLEELNKRRHLLPIRKLVEKYGSIILKIAPCWLATPAAVSSIFPLEKTLFDYVIFDEASQSNVANSLPALERGMHSVIIGDEKQLPPIDHFRIKEDYDDEDSNNDIDIDRGLFSENILSLASRVFNHAYLTWHYRSVYQELIDFSNHAFYDSRLKVAANVTKNVAPIKWVTCNNGSWVNYRNKQEALLVVDELKNVLIKNKEDGLHRSVGIITFNSHQQDEINEEIERRKQQDPEFGKLYSLADNEETNLLEDLPFVRNIERVQGEERDIIIFSTGYAKDPEDNGSIHVRFGSLDKRDGEHYLNVAVTRAREQIIVVSSFDPRRIDAENATHDGPRRFKDYLCFAKAISEHNFEEVKKILASLNSYQYENVGKLDNIDDDSLEKSVSTELQKLGYKVDLHIGHSDYKINLAVVHPDFPSRYILAIEFDGKSFLNAPSAKERDVTRQAFLESKRWAVEWVWSKNWWMNRDKEIARIRQRIEDLRSIQTSHHELYDKLPVRNYYSPQQYEEPVKISSSLISPDRPFTNKVIMWDAIKSCEDYICWVDKYFSKEGLELLVQSLDKSKVKKIRILTSIDKVDDRLRHLFKDFRNEMKYSQVSCEMRVMVDSKLKSSIHDRWIISKNASFNIPSSDVIIRGQYSEVKKTENMPPFDDWWNNSLDIIDDWNRIQDLKK